MYKKSEPKRGLAGDFDTGLTVFADPNNYLLFKFSPQNTILKTGFFRLHKMPHDENDIRATIKYHMKICAQKYSHIWWHNDRIVAGAAVWCWPIWLARVDYANCYTQFYKFTFFMLAWKQRRNYSTSVKRVTRLLCV